MSRRSKTEITYAILCCIHNSVSTFTQITLEARLNNYQAHVFLNEMVERGQLQKKNRHYQITEKGKAYKDKFEELKKTQ